MMLWLQNHTQLLVMLFTAWVAANSILSPISAKLSPAQSSTWWGKALHVFVAISPMDVMKAIKAVGAALVPPGLPPIVGLLVLVGALSFTTGCASSTPAAQSPQVDVRALADASTQLLEAAWEDAGNACLAAARAAHDDTIRQKCEPVLTKARQTLIAAQAGIDAWTATDQRNVPCLIASLSQMLDSVSKVANFQVPQRVLDGIKIAESYVGQCGGAS